MKPIPYPPITDIYCGVDCYRFYAVYRIVLGMALGYLGLSLSLIGVTDSRSPRALIQDGFWPLKFFGFTGIIAMLFWGGPRWLLEAAFIPSCILSGLFLLAQSILLVDFSYDVADWLLERAEHVYEEFNWYAFLLICFTVGSQIFIFASSIYLWIFFPADRSRLTNLATTMLSITMSICSVLDSVREANPNAGIFQSSVLGSYVMFLLLTAILGDPDMRRSVKASGTISYLAATATLLSVAYSAYSTGGSSHKLVSSSAGLPMTTDDCALEVDAEGNEITEYNYALYQFVFVCAALYVGLLITDWKQPVVIEKTFTLIDTKLTFWIKVGTSWIISLLYIWSLFAPLILPHREFY